MTGRATRRSPEPARSQASAHPPLPIVVAEWPRSSSENIRVSLAEYNGRHTIDVRTWWRDPDGDLRPGRGGITLGIAHLPTLASSLGQALTEAKAAGLVGTADIEKAANRLLGGGQRIPRPRGRSTDAGARSQSGHQGAVPQPKRRTKA